MIALLSQDRLHSASVVIMYLAANCFLSFLQLMWSFVLVKEIANALAPSKESKHKKSDTKRDT